MKARYFLFNQDTQTFTPIDGDLTFGRYEGALQFPNDDLVSRKHCQISVVGTHVYAEDLGSTNRTRVNGVALTPNRKRKLALNDIFEFGAQRFVLTNQQTQPPGVLHDLTPKAARQYMLKARRKSDGSFTSQVSRVITLGTIVLLEPSKFIRLRLRELTRPRTWDYSTKILFAVSTAAGALLFRMIYDLGVFRPGLAEDRNRLLVRVLGSFILALGGGIVFHDWFAKGARRDKKSGSLKRLGLLPMSLGLVAFGVFFFGQILGAIDAVSINEVSLCCFKQFEASECLASLGSAGRLDSDRILAHPLVQTLSDGEKSSLLFRLKESLASPLAK